MRSLDHSAFIDTRKRLKTRYSHKNSQISELFKPKDKEKVSLLDRKQKSQADLKVGTMLDFSTHQLKKKTKFQKISLLGVQN